MDLRFGVGNRVPVALTIAGSDSGGGAGIQADLKTFAALGVHGTVVLTAVTAQNTHSIIGVQSIDPSIVGKQIDAIITDLGVNAAKTGMLYTSEIIRVVAEKVSQYGFPLVVDPVMIAKSRARLLKEEAIETLIKDLLPLATVITPNIPEAEVISGIKIESKDDMIDAARIISKLGPRAVVIKGGHLKGEEAVDILLYEGRVYEFSEKRHYTKTTHGTGCCFSAAITAELAKGKDIVSAVQTAKKLISMAIKYGLPIGKGHGPVNPMAIIYRDYSKLRVIESINRALDLLRGLKELHVLIPEVGMNIAEASPYAMDEKDIAAIPGRIRTSPLGDILWSSPKFGASSHLARYILSARKYSNEIRAAINIRFSTKFIETAKVLGYRVSYYDRREEPPEVKSVEGMTVKWGVDSAVRRIGCMPDIIFHRGDWGKEPMIVVFGDSATAVAKKIIHIYKNMNR